MIIKLPDHFDYGENPVKIEDGVLKISSSTRWRDFIYKLTIATKGDKCWYCGKKLSQEEITMDHLYPKDLGGPTIPPNLAPTCSSCNVTKGNITEWQYRRIRNLSEDKKKEKRLEFLVRNERKKSSKGYFLPADWITSQKIDEILVTILVDDVYMGKRYNKVDHFYQQYGHLPYPIILDRNNYLLDGFILLMFAKNHNITEVPTIVLENVEVIFGKFK